MAHGAFVNVTSEETTLSFTKFNVNSELRKFERGEKTIAHPAVLLACIADRYLAVVEGPGEKREP